MTRVKNGTSKIKGRRNILKMVKGFRYGRSTKKREAYEAIFHAGNYAFAHRRDKKGDSRKLWNVKISYASKNLGTSYSKLMGGLKKKGVLLDRKILSTLSEKSPKIFEQILEMSK